MQPACSFYCHYGGSQRGGIKSGNLPQISNNSSSSPYSSAVTVEAARRLDEIRLQRVRHGKMRHLHEGAMWIERSLSLSPPLKAHRSFLIAPSWCCVSPCLTRRRRISSGFSYFWRGLPVVKRWMMTDSGRRSSNGESCCCSVSWGFGCSSLSSIRVYHTMRNQRKYRMSQKKYEDFIDPSNKNIAWINSEWFSKHSTSKANLNIETSFVDIGALRVNRNAGEGGARGQRPSYPFLRGARGARLPFQWNNKFFNNAQFDSMKTMNLTIKPNNHRSLHWSYPNMRKSTSFTSVRIFLIAF